MSNWNDNDDYSDALKPMPWRRLLWGKLLCLLARLIAPFLIILMFIFPPVARADDHHQPPSWEPQVEQGTAGGTYLEARNAQKVYYYNEKLCPSCLVFQNGKFKTGFTPSAGEAYPRVRVAEDVLKSGGSKTQALKAATVGMSKGAVQEYFGTVAKRSLSAGKALAGASGSGLLAVPKNVLCSVMICEGDTQYE